MANNFPGALNTGSSLVNNRNTGDTIPASDHNDAVNAEIAVETKVGYGSSVPTVIGQVLTVTAAGQSAWQAPGGGGGGSATFFNVKTYGALGDGSQDDTTFIQAAINAALATNQGTATVYFPAGTYKITATLICTSATISAGGYGVTLRGDGHRASRILKNSTMTSLPAVTFNGNGGPSGNNTAFGGLIDITLDGNGIAGGLLQTNSAQQMFFRGCSFVGSTDIACDFNTMQDSYFSQMTFNNCGSTSKRVMEIYGSSAGTSNMLYFEQIRFETFLKGAVYVYRGSGATGGGNNGFFWSQCKFENYPTVAGDFVTFDSYTQQVVMDQIFISGGLYNSGYSTPFNGITYGDGTTGAGFNQATFSNIFMNAGPTAGIGNSVVNVNGGGHLSGPITLNNVYADATMTTAIVNINGATGALFNVMGVGGPGVAIGGDGSGVRNVLGASNPIVKGGVTAANLTSGNSTGSLTSAVTASVTPTSNNLVLLTVSIRNGSVQPTTPTVTGNGLTWVAIAHSDFKISGSRRTVYLFRALGASPTAGAITITFGETETDAAWVVDQLAGVVTTGTNGSGAVQQNATNADLTGAATSLTDTLGYFNTARNATYFAVGTDGVDSPNASTNFAIVAHSGNSSIEATSTFSALSYLSPSVSYGGTGLFGGIAIEVVSA